jgi:hypothetical protein
MEMRRMASRVLFFVLLLALANASTASAGVRKINFDDATAPCNFVTATQLTTKYSALGVAFSGATATNGGEVLNECGNFSVTGHSSPNFLAFSTLAGIPGPETITFASPAHSVDIKSGQSGGGTITVTAFDGTTPVSQSFRTAAPALATLSVQAARITSVRLAFTGTNVVFDDLVWGTAPVSGDDSYDTAQNVPLTIRGPGVLGNDMDPDADALTASVTRQPANGTVVLAADGGFTYSPNPGFAGNDAFGYKANDGTGTGNEATVTIHVEAAPVPLPQATAVPTPAATPIPTPTPPALKNMAVTVSYSFLPRKPKKTAQFTTFSVKNLPKGSKVEARCVTENGKKCKGKLGKATTKSNVGGTLRISSFSHSYPAGVQLEVIVTNPAYITQVKIVKVLKNKVPSITTRCQATGSSTRRGC